MEQRIAFNAFHPEVFRGARRNLFCPNVSVTGFGAARRQLATAGKHMLRTDSVAAR
jgi:hypothetical protein